MLAGRTQDYQGRRVSFWYVGPRGAQPATLKEKYAEFFQAFAEAYPNIGVDAQSLGYNDMLKKIRTAALGNAAPMAARLPILWGIEFS